MIDKLELTHLRTLDALNRFDTISAAAEQLDVSQQAVSLQLKKIRAILGDPLFVRTGQGMTPTPYAKLIAPHIRQVLAQLKAIPLPLEVQPGQVERTLVISGTDYTQSQGLRRKVVASAPSFFMALDYLKRSNLVAFMPSRLLPCDGLYEIVLPKYPPGYGVVAAFHPNAGSDPFIAWLLERARARLVSATSPA